MPRPAAQATHQPPPLQRPQTPTLREPRMQRTSTPTLREPRLLHTSIHLLRGLLLRTSTPTLLAPKPLPAAAALMLFTAFRPPRLPAGPEQALLRSRQPDRNPCCTR